MDTLELLLSVRRAAIWERFRNFRTRVFPDFDLPSNPMEAFRLGLQTGYGEGLIDGVDLGMDVNFMAPASSMAVWSTPFEVFN